MAEDIRRAMRPLALARRATTGNRSPMTTLHDHSSNPLHGITLERMLNELVAEFGWARMGRRVRIACFTSDPSVSSSLKFLRRTPWARTKVEAMYLDMKRRTTPKA